MTVSLYAMKRREFSSYLLIGAIGLLLVACAIVTIQYTLPYTRWEAVGPLTDFPPAAYPYHVVIGNDDAFVVNQDGEITVFAPYTTHPYRYRLEWQRTGAYFIDGWLGTKFMLNGTWKDGPASRNLDQYEYRIRNEQLWINFSSMISGDSVCKNPGVICSE